MWRLRRAVAASLLWSRSSIGPVRNEAKRFASNLCTRTPANRHPHRVTVSLGHHNVSFISTKAKRSAAAAGDESGPDEFSESDELEQENQDLKGLDEMEENKHDEEEEEEEQGTIDEDEEDGDDADVAKKSARKSPSESRTFARVDINLRPKEQELWLKVNAVKRGDQVLPVLEAWGQEEGNELTKPLLSVIVGRLQRATKFGFALEIVEWLLEDEAYETSWPALRGSVIECLGRTKGVGSAEKYFKSLPSEHKTKTIYDKMLQQYVSKSNVPKAEALFKEMEDLGLISGTPFAINTMMRLYKKRNSNKFLEMLEKAKSANVEPDIHTYNCMMELKCKKGDIPGMEKILEEIKSIPGLKPDSMTYLAMSRAYIKAGLHEKAELYMLRVENGSQRKGKMVYENLMELYADMGNRDEVDRMWSKAKAIPGDGASSYLNYMAALAKLGDTDAVENMFKRVEGWKKNKYHEEKKYNNLLTAYKVAGNTDKAHEIEEEMKKADIVILKNNNNVKKNNNNNVKKADDKPASSKKAKKDNKSKKSEETKSKKSDETVAKAATTGGKSSEEQMEAFAKRLNAAADKGNVKAAEVIFDECRKAKLSNTDMWNSLLKVYAAAEMPAYGFLQRMAADKAQPNQETTQLLEKTDKIAV